ncbi:hydroxymethylbilane synthase, partial [Butyricicoccus sp. AM29-23AC]
MIKVGSRDSRLAVVQAEEVMRRLGECELVTMKTTGDKILDRTLDKVGGKGLFVKELDRALAAGEVDLTVHSLKDVPMEQPDGLPLIAFPKRADARDALVLPENGNWDREKPIGCSSARRRVQLSRLFPGIEVKPVRGNVQTRLRRLDSGEYGALVLAAAGLHRLGLENRISRYFSPEEMLPAAGQGILAVQAREASAA